MPEETTRLEYLYGLFINDKASAEEAKEFWKLLDQADENHPVKEAVFSAYGGETPLYIQEKDWSKSLQKIFEQQEEIPVVEMHERNRWWWTAAAAIILILLGGWWWISERSNGRHETTGIAQIHDVPAPSNTRAVITLADGSKVYLDSAANGTLATQANITVEKSADGKIVYSSEKQIGSGELVYNTLTNPRGSKVIDMQLSDGSHVWLNAGSSVKYPVAFVGNDRTVEITGEAYFEVTHDANKPFHVRKGQTDVRVLGTHFNVNAYDDEDALRVTLLEGSVRVSTLRQAQGDNRTPTDTRVIKPGEQAILSFDRLRTGSAQDDASGGLQVASGVNVDEVMAWKNGLFQYKRSDIETILRQASRWYGVDVEYQGKITDKFSGQIERTVNLSELLKILEETGRVKLKIEDKKNHCITGPLNKKVTKRNRPGWSPERQSVWVTQKTSRFFGLTEMYCLTQTSRKHAG